jgi:arylsulfatase A-like enzyme
VRESRRKRATEALRTLAALLAIACGAPEPVWVPTLRLAAIGEPGREQAPLATIERDTRPVLRDWPELRIFDARDFPLPPDGHLALRIPVPASLQMGSSLVLEAFVQGNPRLDAYRREFAGAVAIGGSGDAATLELALRIDPRRAWRARGAQPTASAFVTARPLPTNAAIEIADVELPSGAVLELALGILEAAWGQGPVAFRVLACAGPDACEPLFEETVDPAGAERGRWRTRRIPLDARPRERVQLRFEARASGSSWSLPLWGDPTLLREEPRRAGELDLLLVSIDTLRADHLPSWGYPRDTAPFLTSLAARGTLFEQAIAAAPSTTPSHMSLFTALQPSVHGLLGNTALGALPRGIGTLAEVLRDAGFATAAVTEGGGLALHLGFERGFGAFIENPVPLPHRPGLQAPVSFDLGRNWLLTQRDRRSFLFLHTYEVHGPYQAPEAYAGLFAQTPPGLEPRPGLRPHQRPVHYDREIRFVDDELRRLVGALEAAGRLERTLLVLTSDHGEEFLEHGWIGHGATLPEEVLRVPLLVLGPGIPAGRRIEEPVGLVDLAPTLLELLGAPPLPGAMGRSFASLLREAQIPSDSDARPLFSETWFEAGFGAEGPKPVQQPSYSIRKGSRKLVRLRADEGFRYAYFDLSADPGERRDLYAADPGAAADLRALLDAYPERVARLRERLAREPSADRALDPERESRLRALGYLE